MDPDTNPLRSRTLPALCAAVAVITIPLLLAACNTLEGAGEDVSAVGQGVTHAADQTQQAIFPENP
jgi:predicted small secreted protein